MIPKEYSSSEIINKIESLSVKGAYLNAIKASDALSLIAIEGRELPTDKLITKLITTSKLLADVNPSWSIVETACSFIVHPLLEHDNTYTKEEILNLVTHRKEILQSALEKSQKDVAQVGSSLIQDDMTVLVMSYSGTLIEIFLKAWEDGKRFSIIGTESRPNCEGRVMAEILSTRGIPYTLITDPAQSYFVRKGSIAMVGVDSLVATGSVINKVGTMNLALACHHFGVPLYAATSTFKMSIPSLMGRPVELKVVQDNAGIAPEHLIGRENFKVENLFFEETPATLFSGFVCEYGLHNLSSARFLWDRTWRSLNDNVNRY